ncbi:hypothetical protein ABIB40_003016 [Pedobacter sp. UYP30]|uniref:hypothetical protein n=1 Tax=Pedobacter sp. UYP30 TaxID=1756400 RepID=UPI00339A1EF8
MIELVNQASSQNSTDGSQNRGPVVGWNYFGKKRTYAVQTSWQSPNGEKSMYCEIAMYCTKMRDGDAVWEISKSNYFFNNKKSEEPIEQLALACAAPLYPFEFTTNMDGHITDLLNGDKVKTRFASAKSTLQRDFGGEIASAYIAEVESALNQPQQLKKIVTVDLWLSLFFTAINGKYNKDRTKPISVDFPFFGFEEPLTFKGIAALGKPNIEQMTQEINVEADLDLLTAIEGVEILNGRLEIAYDIEIPGHWIKNIDGRATINTLDGQLEVQIQGYLIPEGETTKTAQTEEATKKGNWWSIFGN